MTSQGFLLEFQITIRRFLKVLAIFVLWLLFTFRRCLRDEVLITRHFDAGYCLVGHRNRLLDRIVHLVLRFFDLVFVFDSQIHHFPETVAFKKTGNRPGSLWFDRLAMLLFLYAFVELWVCSRFRIWIVTWLSLDIILFCGNTRRSFVNLTGNHVLFFKLTCWLAGRKQIDTTVFFVGLYFFVWRA